MGPNVRSVLAGLDAEVTPRHNMFIVGPGGLQELLVAPGVASPARRRRGPDQQSGEVRGVPNAHGIAARGRYGPLAAHRGRGHQTPLHVLGR